MLFYIYRERDDDSGLLLHRPLIPSVILVSPQSLELFCFIVEVLKGLYTRGWNKKKRQEKEEERYIPLICLSRSVLRQFPHFFKRLVGAEKSEREKARQRPAPHALGSLAFIAYFVPFAPPPFIFLLASLSLARSVIHFVTFVSALSPSLFVFAISLSASPLCPRYFSFVRHTYTLVHLASALCLLGPAARFLFFSILPLLAGYGGCVCMKSRVGVYLRRRPLTSRICIQVLICPVYLCRTGTGAFALFAYARRVDECAQRV